MSVISFASSKGGAGKTTSAIILATTLAQQRDVVVIDADPSQRLISWSRKRDLPARLKVVASEGELLIHGEIDDARSRAGFVILDLEGAATRRNAYAMGESDLVIIPMGDEQQDAEGAIETLAQLAVEARAMRRDIPVRIVFARTKAAVKSRLARTLNAQVRDKVGCFAVELHDRTAFSSLHNLGGTLYDMDQADVGGVIKAIDNAERFAAEVLSAMDQVFRIQAASSENFRREQKHAQYS